MSRRRGTCILSSKVFPSKGPTKRFEFLAYYFDSHHDYNIHMARPAPATHSPPHSSRPLNKGFMVSWYLMKRVFIARIFEGYKIMRRTWSKWSIITIIGSQISRSGAIESMAISSKLYSKCTCTNNLLQSHWTRSLSKSRIMHWFWTYLSCIQSTISLAGLMIWMMETQLWLWILVVSTCCRHVITLPWCFIAMMENAYSHGFFCCIFS